MKKNVAGQAVGAQMVDATTGGAFSGSVTVSVTGDAGTQATGSVGSGACTHEGNGYHTYAPAQAETNYDLVAFTFTGTGAVPATVQIYTGFPQTGDSFARIGSNGAGLTAVALSSAGIQAIWDALTSALTTVGSVGKLLVDNVNATISSRLASASYTAPDNATITAIAGYVDTEVAAIKAKTDNLPASPAATGDAMTLTSGERTAVADALLDRNMATGTDSGGRTVRNALRFLRNKWSLSGTTLTVTKEDDSTTAWTATVSTDAAAVPVVGNDPA
jgi:hypothetical protein